MKTLLKIYHSVNQATECLTKLHADRLQCKQGCADCCVDELSVFEVEAVAIQTFITQNDLQIKPHPIGKCVFLDSNQGCQIYEARPYVCRTQGLPLRWLKESDTGEWIEYRDICPLNETGPEITSLAETDCWTLGPTEGQLAELQAKTSAPERRTRLRDLVDRRL